MKPDFARMLHEGDSESLAMHVERMFGFSVPPKKFLKACRDACPTKNYLSMGKCGNNDSWSECTWRCWFKPRALRFAPVVHTGNIRDHVSCLFHVGFLFIEETPEQLERLRNENEAEPGAPRKRFSRLIVLPQESFDTKGDAMPTSFFAMFSEPRRRNRRFLAIPDYLELRLPPSDVTGIGPTPINPTAPPDQGGPPIIPPSVPK